MIKILHIESSANVCSVCVSENDQSIASLHISEKNVHAVKLTVLIEELLKNNEIKYQQLNAIAVSEGPGSYTGLRIGVSVAKGLAYGLNIPLIAVNTLASMLYNFYQDNKHLIEAHHFYIPMLDARRKEVYYSVFNHQLKQVQSTGALDLAQDHSVLNEFIDKAYIFGNGAHKVNDLNLNFKVYEKEYINATGMVSLAYDHYMHQKFVDTAYFEPFYLKDFVAIKSKNKVLGKQ